VCHRRRSCVCAARTDCRVPQQALTAREAATVDAGTESGKATAGARDAMMNGQASAKYVAQLAKSRDGCTKRNADNDTKRKEDGLLLMNRVRANGQLVTLLEGLPLNARGKTKQYKEQAMKVPCTLLFSFQNYVDCIKTPTSAITSLLLATQLDDEGKDIVRAMLSMRRENKCASNTKYRK